MVKDKKPKIGITVGDINGIGIEIIIKALSDKRINDLCTPIVYGSAKIFSVYRKILKINEFKITEISEASEAKKNSPNIVPCWKKEPNIEPGKPTKEAGKYAFLSLEKCISDLKEQTIDAMVTAPINKATIQSEAFSFPGHTEYLASKDETDHPLMLLVSDTLKVATVTGHVPIRSVADRITTENVVKKIEMLNKSLIQDFGIVRPKIAVLGLNPHAGDNGLIGDEDQHIVIPAIGQVKTKEIFAFGPFPADGFFGSGNFKNFDGILAMYHDQGLIAMKTLSFNEGVNFTAGLSFIRTSPDHGTAYDIVGKNRASTQSFLNALYLACDVVRQRRNAADSEMSASQAPSKDPVPQEVS